MSIFINRLKHSFFSKTLEVFLLIYLNFEKIQSNIVRKKQFLKVKNNLLELEKDFIDLKDIELKDKEIKIKKEIEKLFFKPTFVSMEDMDWFEDEEMKKISPNKNTWYDWLINNIPKPIRKSVSVLKNKFISLFKTNTPKQTVYGKGLKISKPRKQNIKKPFISEKNEEKIKDRIIRDVWKLFEREEEKEERKKQE